MYLKESALLLLLSTRASSFILQPSERWMTRTEDGRGAIRVVPTFLEAKAKKKKKATTTKSGGFGTVVAPRSTKKKNDNGDYDAFPALEEKVQTTLEASTAEGRENAQELSNDMYDRLGHIYGFPDFNFPPGWFDEQAGDDDAAATAEKGASLDELMMVGGPSSTSSPVSSGMSDLLTPATSTASATDFSDLIASATGDAPSSSKTTSSTAEKPQSSEIGAIENLPPFTKFRVLHVDPMVLAVDDFFTEEECDEYVALCANPKKRTDSNDMPMMSRSKTVGKDSLSKAQRTSTTWFHHFKSVPALAAKASRLFGLKSISRWEEPQTVRYQQTEKFTWHLDALAPSESLAESGGQRVATLLVYLTDVGENNGGATLFRDLGDSNDEGDYLRVQPKKGSALLFFPSAGGIPNTPFDIRTLHAGEALSPNAPAEKWIAQMWLRENDSYKPTAPPGNTHAAAEKSIVEFCETSS